MLAAKTNVRVLEVPLAHGTNEYDYKRVGGGMLVQTPDASNVAAQPSCKVVTKKQPTAHAAGRPVVRLARGQVRQVECHRVLQDGMTLGVGAGQMSRVDCARIASIKAQNAGLALRGFGGRIGRLLSVPRRARRRGEAGARAVIQPGGSVRDDEVIAAADEHGIAMVFTGVRHFRH